MGLCSAIDLTCSSRTIFHQNKILSELSPNPNTPFDQQTYLIPRKRNVIVITEAEWLPFGGLCSDGPFSDNALRITATQLTEVYRRV